MDVSRSTIHGSVTEVKYIVCILSKIYRELPYQFLLTQNKNTGVILDTNSRKIQRFYVQFKYPEILLRLNANSDTHLIGAQPGSISRDGQTIFID